ncbi:RNA-protein complex protein Nop10 [Candidatus Woesearchaeota archaeon]|jgi:H/ACA ribonucleoprotein complex subunit 3|nr:RNA-protein complex protein Nop10 [Candidatus Woesearchaeota archaeon]MBT3439053.1 RNA-protein complex protein Nop10 [Candidatus Woesearchaeota archaeon]MBT4058039.1 RNA-protein complex protein Nop10 [Candidatus Woesearchaeota archaeon]MBT4207122.1 RNA-protein complex protein Nop10 [Candidatus Woesearchaeota archaeon]MBT4731340.1 RNA-protein complex protein Nop10 [Candidatus Woesearchaeota archaeon]
MKTEILKCLNCNTYTLKKNCETCNNKTCTNKPAKYSPEDKYGHYRRLAKIEKGEL